MAWASFMWNEMCTKSYKYDCQATGDLLLNNNELNYGNLKPATKLHLSPYCVTIILKIFSQVTKHPNSQLNWTS